MSSVSSVSANVGVTNGPVAARWRTAKGRGPGWLARATLRRRLAGYGTTGVRSNETRPSPRGSGGVPICGQQRAVQAVEIADEPVGAVAGGTHGSLRAHARAQLWIRGEADDAVGERRVVLAVDDEPGDAVEHDIG